jgi:hypothetical protein
MRREPSRVGTILDLPRERPIATVASSAAVATRAAADQWDATRGDPAASRRDTPPGVFGPTVALAVLFAFAAVAALLSAVLIVVDPRPIPGLPATQRQDAETSLYVAAFAVVLPLALIVAPRLARRIDAGANAAGLPTLTALLAAGAALAAGLVRVASLLDQGATAGALAAAVAAWWLAAIASLARAAGGRPWKALLTAAPFTGPLVIVAASLTVATLFGFAHLESLSPVPLVLAAVAIPLSLLTAGGLDLPRLGRRWGVGLDLTIAGLLVLAISNLVIITPEAQGLDFTARYLYGVEQFHADFLLGPANQVLGGSPMLVDTASQYGVGSIVFLAGWFNLVPIGYGTFGFLDGILTGAAFVAGYSILRASGVSRLLAGGALAVGVLALVWNRTYPLGTLVQEGPLRFGLPVAVILASVVAARWPRFSRLARLASLVAVGISAIWALEAFALTAVTFAAIAAFSVLLVPSPRRARWVVRQALLVLAAFACAHVVFAAGTLAGTGHLPDFGQYLAYLDAFLFGSLGDLTYDFSRWSPGIALGAVYLASAVALGLVLRLKPELVRREHVALTALTGTTAYGIALFAYLVDRSGDHVVAYVSLPAVLIGTLWLSLLLRPNDSTRLARGAAIACGLSVAALLASAAWSSIGPRFPDTALAHLAPGGDSTRAALERLWHFPPLSPAAPAGERLLERYLPGERRSVVLVKPDLGVEILMRSGRSNRLPIAYPWGDGFVEEQRIPGLRRAVADLLVGDRMLLDQGTLETFRAQPVRRPGNGPGSGLVPGSATAPLQLFALQKIAARFRLRPIHRDNSGLVVVQLGPRA